MKILFFLAPLFIPKTYLKYCLKRQLEILWNFKVLNPRTKISPLDLSVKIDKQTLTLLKLQIMKNLYRLLAFTLVLGLFTSCSEDSVNERDEVPVVQFFDLKLDGTTSEVITNISVIYDSRVIVTKDINPDDEDVEFIVNYSDLDWDYKLIFTNTDSNVESRIEVNSIGTENEEGLVLTDIYIPSDLPQGTYSVSIEHNGEVKHRARQTLTMN